ncbi:histidine kinase [Rhodoblastus sp.]|uniref:sensor histidine kinase n=1 Tax=Rhodoblastus sp. TaxID=1962975 RepID=UPI0035B09AC8
MRLSRKIDLKLRLALRVAAIAAFCFVAAFFYLLFDSERAARARLSAAAEVVARDLALQLAQAHWVKPARDDFPDLQRIATPLMAPGLCIAYRDEQDEARQSLCGGRTPGEAPEAFGWLYRSLFDPGAEARRPIAFEGRTMGAAAASYDPRSRIEQVWREASRFLGLMAATLLALCLLVYAALARALRPTRAISRALEKLAADDLSARLPAFDLAELTEVGTVFNAFAAKLETTLAERRELTRRLIAVQEEERRRLARDLHDEFGQCLAAIGANAASLAQTAREDCPALVPECETIARTSANMMGALRGALSQLRPPDLDELGLAAGLERLVAGWRRRGGAQFIFAATGDFDGLPPFLSGNLYRIAQEALTNAAKHADAATITLSLARRPGSGADEIELTVSDDGKASPASLEPGEGLGLVGIRERVAALGGQMDYEARHPTGLILRVAVPAPQAQSETEGMR